jgi:hypothetical protein
MQLSKFIKKMLAAFVVVAGLSLVGCGGGGGGSSSSSSASVTGVDTPSSVSVVTAK